MQGRSESSFGREELGVPEEPVHECCSWLVRGGQGWRVTHTLGCMAISHFISLIDEYKSAHGVSDAELARRIGVTRQNLGLWRDAGLRALPTQLNLRAVATAIRRPYRQVLDAALRDVGYLTDIDTDGPRPYGEVLADAVRCLTEAARLTNQPMRQSVSGDWEPNQNGTPQRIDWAAFVTEALAGAAANIGGTEAILAGRPGSWEAAKVRVRWR